MRLRRTAAGANTRRECEREIVARAGRANPGRGGALHIEDEEKKRVRCGDEDRSDRKSAVVAAMTVCVR
ncbi:hypothetical protein Hanom_Chr04g00344331 [Helianthus anomalus]